MIGAVRGLWEAVTAPEVVAALKEDRAEGIRATRQLDSWSVGELLYRVLAGEELMGSGNQAAMVVQDKDGRARGDAQLERYLEGRVDKVEDVMGKYLVENLTCVDPRDRMSLRDALLYVPQLATCALSPTQDVHGADEAGEWDSIVSGSGIANRSNGNGFANRFPFDGQGSDEAGTDGADDLAGTDFIDGDAEDGAAAGAALGDGDSGPDGAAGRLAAQASAQGTLAGEGKEANGAAAHVPESLTAASEDAWRSGAAAETDTDAGPRGGEGSLEHEEASKELLDSCKR
jgi:hypothetical protein